jgi:pyruvate dehydrogenase E2 component (dihydrolipoamide acetyltransferase)
VQTFKLPSLGADMTAGRLVEWRVKPGERVERGQVVLVVETDKAAIEVECWQAGVVHELLVPAGEKVPVGTPLALLLEPGEVPPAVPLAPPAAPAPVVPDGSVRAAPGVRRRARELGLDLAALARPGTGTVTREDLERAVAAPRSSAPAGGADLRGAIAAAMSRSKREIPHYHLAETIPLARATAWLERLNRERPVGERLVLAALLLRSVARAAQEFPDFNGWFVDGAHRPCPEVHLGGAVALRGGGVIAPTLRAAQGKSLVELMRELTALVTRARSGTLRSSELEPATLTVTSLGERGVQAVFGVIHPPQVALVGFGTPGLRPWVVDGEVRPLPVLTATLAADHRVSDGHRGALFLARVADLLQEPGEQ